MAIPSSAFVSAKSIFTGRSIVQLKVGATPTTVVFESRLLNHKISQTEKEIKRPDSAGVLRVVRKVLTEQSEEFSFEVDEGKRVVTDLFGGSLAGYTTATCSLWMPDPADATSKCAMVSEADFTCTVTRDGDMKFGDGDFTKATIKISSTKQGAVTFTSDATIT